MKRLILRFICELVGHKWAKLRIRHTAGIDYHWFYCQRCKERRVHELINGEPL